MSSNYHIIRNLNLEVEFQDSSDAFALRDTLTHVCKTELLPSLENLFDEKNNKGKIIRAEKIVIDLGIIDREGWNQTLVDQVIAQLATQFGKTTPLPTRTNAPQKGNAKTSAVRESASASVTEISEEENIVESIFYFLKTGLLPWYTVIKSQGDFAQHLARLIREPGSHFYVRMLAEIQQNVYALRRLIDQTPDEIIETAITLSGVTNRSIKSLLNCWSEIFKQSGISQITPKHTVYQAAVSIVMERSPERPFTELTSEHIIQRLEAVHNKKLSALFAGVNRSFDRTFVVGEEERKVVRFIEQRMKEMEKRGTDKKDTPIKDAPIKKNTDIDKDEKTNENTASRNVKDFSVRKKTSKNIVESTEGGFYITNAGLVILNPFLVLLFENVGYLEEKKWISENHQQRAVLLTQYLVTGKQEYPEFDLLLNKILTGYPLEDSVPADIMLSDFEIKEAQDVLQSVIQHWKALKNTSIPGLQGTFFQREGKLLYNDDQWLLSVEQQTVDILLNKLPWGISIIKLPWMENRVHVEWT